MGRLIALFVSLVAICSAETGTATVTFDASKPAAPEYVVEMRQSDDSWVEVAKGPASPIAVEKP